jgi:hypothetical protein
LLPLALASALVACNLPTRPTADESFDQQAVRQNFNAYKYALLNDLGIEAADLVSEKTLRHYDQLRQLALTGELAELKELPSFNRLVVLAIRHNIPAATMRKMQGKEIFAYGVKNQWVAKDSVAPFELGTINVYGNYASGNVTHGGNPVNSYLEFRKENEVWRINLQPLLDRVTRERSAQLNSYQDENKAIVGMIEQMSGRKVDANIWTPPGRDPSKDPSKDSAKDPGKDSSKDSSKDAVKDAAKD